MIYKMLKNRSFWRLFPFFPWQSTTIRYNLLLVFIVCFIAHVLLTYIIIPHQCVQIQCQALPDLAFIKLYALLYLSICSILASAICQYCRKLKERSLWHWHLLRVKRLKSRPLTKGTSNSKTNMRCWGVELWGVWLHFD